MRIAGTEDIPTLHTLAHDIWNLHYPDIISQGQIDYMLEKMYAADVIASEMYEGILWKLILADGAPIGFVSYSMLDASTCKLHKIYVHPDHHGIGAGRYGLEDCAAYARARGAREIVLYVNRRNEKAIRAYTRFGFTVAREEDNAFGPYYSMCDYVMTMAIGKSSNENDRFPSGNKL